MGKMIDDFFRSDSSAPYVSMRRERCISFSNNQTPHPCKAFCFTHYTMSSWNCQEKFTAIRTAIMMKLQDSYTWFIDRLQKTTAAKLYCRISWIRYCRRASRSAFGNTSPVPMAIKIRKWRIPSAEMPFPVFGVCTRSCYRQVPSTCETMERAQSTTFCRSSSVIFLPKIPHFT